MAQKVEQKEKNERRRHRRYRAREGVYAAVSPNARKLGQIVDISIGGLAFKYVAGGNDPREKSRGNGGRNTLFLSSMGYYVGDIPFETVADYPVNIGPASKLNTVEIRKMHVKFADMNFKQMFDLDYYIRQNTTEQTNFSQT